MTKTELVDAISERAGVSKRDADEVISAMVGVVTDELKQDGKVAITGFGTFKVSHRKGRIGVNPQDPSKKIEIPPMNVPKFTPGKTLKDALK